MTSVKIPNVGRLGSDCDRSDVLKWLVDNLGCYDHSYITSSGPGWVIEWQYLGKSVDWTVNFEDDEKAIEFKLRFL